MLNKKITIKKICISAILASLCYVFTMFISIPLSSTGYINLSDFFIVFTTICIDPLCGLLVSIIGPSLADLTLGYYIYIPFTVLAKVLECIVVHLLFNKINNKSKYLLIFISSIVMASIYIMPDLIVLGFDQIIVALINFLFNTIQGIVGVILGLIIYKIFKKYDLINKIG